MHRVENKTERWTFLSKVCKPCITYTTNFLSHNFLVATLKLKKVSLDFLLEVRFFRKTFWQ